MTSRLPPATLAEATGRASRRRFIGAAGGAALLAMAGVARGAEAPAKLKPMAGSLDLSQIDVVDTHMHPLKRALISQSYARQAAEFGGLAVPPGDYPGRDALAAYTQAGGERQVWTAPRRIGYFDYIARTYGVPPTMAGFDSVTSKHIGSDADFRRYIQSVLDRERVSTVVLQAAEPTPAAPDTLIPAGRYVWTTLATDMIKPAWAIERGLTSIADVAAAIEQAMEQAVANGCRGFKSMLSYQRSQALSQVDIRAADAAFQLLRAPAANAGGPRDDRSPPPLLGGTTSDAARPRDATAAAALTAYEDFLLKRIYMKAGALERPMIIHLAVALHPSLRVDYNDPRPLYAVFVDPDIQKARTEFVLIHAGYPAHHIVGAFVSQFANVFVDVSFFSKYPGALLDVYRTLLSLGPSEKIMHGSDANTVPEEIGYCAWNSRAVLAKVLSEYRDSFGWLQSDIAAMAENILHKNARRIFNIV
ncbi:amidohydrolase family protein [Sphingomonas flavalba]|uniref:amidohydrolase family protein n=1 Tax=Sphingomonas flavalba TaxID=2559804 RepID=UPI00109E33AD|nr:amidohydrolase family protein [Sphingomonas flavalba]